MTEPIGCVLAVAPAGISTDAIVEVYGRLHLLVLHFPIALIILAASIELWRAAIRERTVAGASVVCLVFGALGAAVAASSGWIHATHTSSYVLPDGSDEFVLAAHRWLGVASAAFGLVAALMALTCVLSKGKALVPWTRVLILISAVTVGVASHYGGTMAWGENYVLAPLTERPAETVVATDDAAGPEDPVEPATEAVDGPDLTLVTFEADVEPILAQHCYRCHGEARQRGGIRLDSLEDVMLEVVPGKPDQSYLIEVMRLPEDHDLHMPKNKPSLPDEQINTIAAWIASLSVAAESPSAPPPVDVAPTEEPAPAPSDVTAEDYAPPAAAPLPTLDDAQRAERDERIAALRDAGFIAGVIAASEDAVEVRVGGGASSITDEHVSMIAGLESSLVILDLSASGITDASLETIGSFTHLRRLRLGRTSVTDAGLSHLAGLRDLESLDLHMTAVSDEGLPALESLGQLRTLYLWATEVSKTGAAGLRASRPWLEVDLGSQ